jgi:iron(III) transport system permease protein
VRRSGSLTAPATSSLVPQGTGATTAWTAAAVAIAVVVIVPVATVVASLARPARDVWRHLWETQLLELLVNTLALLAGVGAATLVLGTILAWLVVAYQFPGRAVFEWALVLPLAVPAYVLGFAFLGLLDYAGPVQTTLRRWGAANAMPDVHSWGGVVGVMTLAFYPYVYLLARTAFREQGPAILETAQSLGHSRVQTFLGVVLPMARPSLAAGVTLVLMETLADFGTVTTFGYRTLTEAIYRVWYGLFDRTAASQLATLLLLFALGLLGLERALRGRARFTQGSRRGTGVPRTRLGGVQALAATTVCGATLALGFVIPVSQLLVWAREAADARGLMTAFGRMLATTVTLASSAAAIAAVLALVLGYASRLRPTTLVRQAARLASIGYALPGSVIAVGILISLARLDHLLGAGLEAIGHDRVGLVLTGSVIGLVFAYVVRFLALSFQTIEASLTKIPPSFDDAARSLGAGVGGTLRRVHLPLLRGGLLTALILVFVDTMKEMPATLLLRPFGLETLAVAVWERTSESMWAEASVPALVIVLAGLGPVFLAVRFSGRR